MEDLEEKRNSATENSACMKRLLEEVAKEPHDPIENALTFDIYGRFREACDNLPGPILSAIVSSRPDGLVRLFHAAETSYAIWEKHVGTSEILRNKNWKEAMHWIRNQGPHDTCWAVVAAELISALRFILGYDEVYTDYSAQFFVDFIDMEKGKREYQTTGEHYCFKYRTPKALRFAQEAGVPLAKHWRYIGCTPEGPKNYRLPKVPHIKVDSIEEISSVHDALPHLEFHPIGAALALFEPDYRSIGKGVYRGPESQESYYKGLHAVSIYGVIEESGETIALVKSSHGEKVGDKGYFKVSLDVEMIEVPRKGCKIVPTFKKPMRLLSRFCFPRFAPQ